MSRPCFALSVMLSFLAFSLVVVEKTHGTDDVISPSHDPSECVVCPLAHGSAAHLLCADYSDYDYNGPGYETVPDIEADRSAYDILSWDLEPGDALLFSYRTLHGARPNLSTGRRRGFSTRWLGDDVTYAVRPGVTSPPYHDIGLGDGDPLPDDLFPVVWTRPADPVLRR